MIQNVSLAGDCEVCTFIAVLVNIRRFPVSASAGTPENVLKVRFTLVAIRNGDSNSDYWTHTLNRSTAHEKVCSTRSARRTGADRVQWGVDACCYTHAQ